jgi:NADH oxidase (H2O2-forming)
MDMDAVILSMGYRPNSILAKEAGIPVDEDGFVIVDEYMRTEVDNVFAIGDCAQKRDFVTRRRVPTMLASTACAEARIAGMNLFNLNVVKTFSGTIAIYSTALDDNGFGTAGVTEQRAKLEGLQVVTGLFEGIDRHPGNLPGAHKQIVKLVAADNSGVIIGGEVIGGPEAGELTNVIGLAVQNRMTVNSFLTMQIGTHPCLTASPAAYPLIKAAEQMAIKLKNK